MHHKSAENHGTAHTSQNAASNRSNTKYEKRPVGATESQVRRQFMMDLTCPCDN